MAFLDTVGVASILPFIAVLTNPSLIQTNLILNTMFQASGFFGVENNEQFFLSFLVVIIISPLEPLEPKMAAEASFKTEIDSTCSCGIEFNPPAHTAPSTTISGDAEAFIEPIPLMRMV